MDKWKGDNGGCRWLPLAFKLARELAVIGAKVYNYSDQNKIKNKNNINYQWGQVKETFLLLGQSRAGQF